MSKRQEVIDLARSCVGSKCIPGQMIPRTFDENGKVITQGGFDCIMLCRYCGEEAGLIEVDLYRARKADLYPYEQEGEGYKALKAFDMFVDRIPRTGKDQTYQPGDIVCFVMKHRTRGNLEPHHFGIYVGDNCVVHAGKYHGVHPRTLDHRYRVAFAWAYPGIDD